jgi:hypothetical protein
MGASTFITLNHEPFLDKAVSEQFLLRFFSCDFRALSTFRLQQDIDRARILIQVFARILIQGRVKVCRFN